MSVVAAARRAERLPHVYAHLRRWYEHEALLYEYERRFLAERYERWLARERLTAGMAVELLLLHVRQLDWRAADPAGDPAAEREQMIQLLMRSRASGGLSDRESELLSALEFLQIRAANLGAPLLLGRTEGGLRVYERESPSVVSEYADSCQRYRPEVNKLIGRSVEAIESSEVLRLHGRRPGGVIRLGERQRLLHELAGFKRELGDDFISPSSTMTYRASRVRKWKQLALRDRGKGSPWGLRAR